MFEIFSFPVSNHCCLSSHLLYFQGHCCYYCRTAVLYIYNYPLEDSTLTLHVGRIQMVTRDIGLPPMSWI